MTDPVPAPTDDAGMRSAGRPVPAGAPVRDLVLIAVWFVALGVLGAVVWWLVTDPPHVTVLDGQRVVIGEDLERQVSIDGWYAVIALVGGLLSGLLLTAWLHRDPVLTVAAATLASGLTAGVMLVLGKALGPGSPREALAGQPDGAPAPMQLVLHAPGVAWLWPTSVALGCLLQLWAVGRADDAPDEPTGDPD